MVILTAFPSFLHSTRAQSTLPPRYTHLHSRETHHRNTLSIVFLDHRSFKVENPPLSLLFTPRYPLVLVTTYNVSNLAVRYVPLIKVLNLESRKGIMILVLSRFLFIPLFYFTSKYGDQGWMIVLVFFLGVTTGYPITCIMTLAPQSYMGPERYALGNVLVLSLQIGCLIGISLDWLWIVGNGNF
ncbi:equilibrative nucleotide transporter 3 [Artemisia annua]|uniref:Equilibrative nucleotide transporter 3 n=1 Tax=Artemisia annua TaxID=35608 RepID=A0A2U1L3X0_ARTAN|nr:equilibrative nucleotide transporter 3 [Artemisia annua]